MMRRGLHIALMLLASVLLLPEGGVERAVCTGTTGTDAPASFYEMCVDPPAEERDDLFPDAPVLQPVIVGDRRTDVLLAIEHLHMPLSVPAPSRRPITALGSDSDRLPFSHPLSVLCVYLS
ncbi:MAG: hypothetical protein WD423_10025 [Rhodothermales bacterium]